MYRASVVSAVMIQFVVVAALVALLGHQKVLAAGGLNDGSIIDSLAVETDHRHIMEVVRERRPQRFSYCLRWKERVPGQRHGFLRFDEEVPSTSGMPHAELLYNSNHDADYGPYFVELVGVSMAGRALEGINADTFRRDETTGRGGTVLDVGRPGLVMARAAYDILERAVEERVRLVGLPRVSHPGYSFCLRGPTAAFWQLMPIVTLHFREPGAEVWIPPRELFGMAQQDACMTVVPGDTTVIGALPQVDTRFTFDLRSGAVFFKAEKCDLDTGR